MHHPPWLQTGRLPSDLPATSASPLLHQLLFFLMGRIWAPGHLGRGPGRNQKVLLYIGFFSAKKSVKKYGPKDLLLQRLSLALAASLSRSSHENTGSSNYFANLRGCASYVVSDATAFLQSSITLHVFRLHGSRKSTRQQSLRRPGGL
jgi:hypothetical protein